MSPTILLSRIRSFTLSIVLVSLSVSPAIAGEAPPPAKMPAGVSARIGSPTGSEMVFDALVARPVGLGSMIVGSAAFVVSLPFSIPSGSVGNAFDKMVKEPTGYTFKRCLGCIHQHDRSLRYRR
jgi:hypothetical protein